MKIEPFGPSHVREAASMFVASLDRLRREVPALPATLSDADGVVERLAETSGFAATEDGRLIGYLTGWFPIEGFRGTARKGAYVPEWGHGAAGDPPAEITRALYRAVSTSWADAGCKVHAITLLAGDPAIDTWFWNGFGMGTVDAVRPMTPLGATAPAGVTLRRADVDDAGILESLDAEHRRHYEDAPVFMASRAGDDAAAWEAFLASPVNTGWVAEDPEGPVGFIRFDRAFDGSDVIESSDGVFASGAYVRPAHRGHGVATAILDAALRHYAGTGLTFCAVDFEAFNPEATAFWLRHFTPVCHSLMRIPEAGTR